MDSLQGDSRDVAGAWEAAMRRGDFEGAWRETDRIEIPRRAAQAKQGFVHRPEHLKWNGEPFAGLDVLVRCEHGLGDTIQFIRYEPLIRQVARSVTVLVQPPLVALFHAACPVADVRNGWIGETPPHDVEIEVMELPYAFRSTCDTLPRQVPYLATDVLRALGGDLPSLAADGALRVGIAWSASDWDATRSVPLSALAPLAEVPGVRFYSLQQGRTADEHERAPFAIEPYSRYTQRVELAAAAMLELDLVLTVDSMVAHLAGALGRPVVTLLKHRADWRWMDSRDDTPWYPTMRLVRQAHPGDWRGVAGNVAALLSELAAER